MKDIPNITDSEWEIMRLLWHNEPLTAEEIGNLLGEKMNWTSATIKTFMARLVKKEAVSFTKKGRARYYYPLILEKECQKHETKSFLQKVFNGAAGLLISNFLEDKELTYKEIEDLENILKEKKKKKEKEKK